MQARAVTGDAEPAAALTAAENRLAVELLPADEAVAARWAVAVMELGALVCTARSPQCGRCPLEERCAWVLAGRPAHDGARPALGRPGPGRTARCAGGCWRCCGRAGNPSGAAALAACWADAVQRERCLDGLVADGLVEPLHDGRFALPRS